MTPAGPLLPAPLDGGAAPPRAAGAASPYALSLSLLDPEVQSHVAFERRAAALAASGAPPHVRLRFFHGSRAQNWLSILRTGLQALSGTEFKAVGALHGPGVYTSTELATARGYAGHGAAVVCVAECEALVPATQAARLVTSEARDADGVKRVSDFCVLRRADHVRVIALHLLSPGMRGAPTSKSPALIELNNNQSTVSLRSAY